MESITRITKPISHYVDSIIKSIEDGEVNPLEVFVNLKKIEKVIDNVLKSENVKDALEKEYQKYGNREVDFNGAIITRSESGVKFDYSVCQDPLIINLENEKKELEDKIKDRQKLLKNLPTEGMTELNEETGEVNTLFPPARYSTTIIKASIK